MAKKTLTGWLREPATAILGTRAKVAVLRVLWKAAGPMSHREVVRRVGMAYRSVDLALAELLAIGVVDEIPGGRERRVRLQSTHRLTGALHGLLQAEADFFPALRIELASAARALVPDGLLTAAIVGAVPRREEHLAEAIDVVLIAHDAMALDRCRIRLDAVGTTLLPRFGVAIQLIGYDLDTARAMWRKRATAAVATVRQADLLAGQPLEALLGG